MIELFNRLFPVWALSFSALALWQPDFFIQLKSAIVPLLALIMFCMGLSLTTRDFSRVFVQPKLIGLGLLLQYTVMPLAAFVLSLLFPGQALLAAGLILLGASPGGTASNVVCFLARGNVALSISLTSLSTLLAVLMTPALSWLYIDTAINVPVLDMLQSILLLIILPVTAGLLLNQFLHPYTHKLQPALPSLAMLAIVTIIAIVVALNHTRLEELSLLLLLAVILHNAIGLLLGYAVTRWAGYSQQQARTLAIETGMQNSGLAVALALKHFAPLAALPGALFSIWHNLSGSLLASYWSRRS